MILRFPVPLANSLFLLGLFSEICGRFAQGRRGHPISCYSCMSHYYHLYWSSMADIFNEPANYSDHCENPYGHRIGSKICSGQCVVLSERHRVIGRIAEKRQFIRGCSDGFLREPNRLNTSFAQSAFLWHSPTGKCRSISWKNLISHPRNSDLLEGDVFACLCHRDYCDPNADSGTGIPLLHRLLIVALIVLVGWTRGQEE